MGRMSRNKGKVGEREVAELLRNYGFKARRGVQFHGGSDSPDVIGLPGHHVEVKRCETLSIYKAMEQAHADRAEGTVPVIFHRRNDHRWLVVLEATDYLHLLRHSRGGQNSQASSRQLVENAENSCSIGVDLNSPRIDE